MPPINVQQRELLELRIKKRKKQLDKVEKCKGTPPQKNTCTDMSSAPTFPHPKSQNGGLFKEGLR